MKKITTAMFLSGIALALVTTGCRSKKNKEIPIPSDEVEIKLPCSEYKSDAKTFRAFSFGESMDLNTAKRKALSNARAELAGMLSTTMKVVGDNYVKSSEYNNREEILERFEENARTVINQELRGVIPVCERSTKVKNSNVFKYYVALELSADRLADSYFQTLSRDQSLRIDYNYERFKQTFEEEMRRFEEGR
ncbi:hypothetical protein [Schleiferia thermophila]|jgi:valyl-tRNA synthetase|nr:hypothetical protein [Schleiferia thermophila]KFD40311.1 hypothetical protein AT05_01530 [Schleiferia thermophila str. Yellowstone]PMB36102.1 hypothetical protein CEN47_08705 [Fischerella thermalis CCMEE 5319]GCD78978.1 hypothetical protein JCM30197_02250 [Schleiferia thermophila]